MFRFGAIRFGAGAGVAAGAAAATTSSTESHARVRPSRVAKVVDGRRGPIEEGIEDGSEEWLSFNMEGDVVNFNKEEVKEGIEDIMGITQAGVQQSDDVESIESFGEDADAIIDRSNVAQPSSSSSSVASSQMEALAGITERLLSRPSMQKELIDALKDDDELNSMFGHLAKNKGVEIELLQYPRRPLLPAPVIEDVAEEEVEEAMNPLQSLIHDIGKGLEAAGEGVSKAGDHVGDFLGKTGRWVKNKVQPNNNPAENEADGPVGEEELGNAEIAAGAVLCFAGAVMVLLVAKRFGLLRVLRQAVAV
ncbi:hypothetical protein BSKO_02254 [Bryopsis sp. KO-2023]|nr:hypothetical protein BSKO_02254 [Bryopsis sp. KO-2023]